jgi:hypothetical protein
VATSANEAMLLEDARFTTGAQLERICRKYATVVRAAKNIDENADREQRTVWRHYLSDGMVRIEATLHPEEAAIVRAALDQIARDRLKASEPAAQDSLATTEPPATAPHSISAPPRVDQTFSRVDALLAMAQGVLRGSRPDRSPTELVVTISAETLHYPHAAEDPIASLADGTCVSAETARRLACDCGVVHIHEDAIGSPLFVGRKTRSISGALKRALLRRDQCCRFPGCTNHLYVEGHHIEHWADGGDTSIDNLVTICGHHHRFVHEYGYRIELDATQQPRFFDPRGREVKDVPAAPQLPDLGWPALLDRNTDLEITAETAACLWDGRPVDYGAVIDELVRVDGLT